MNSLLKFILFLLSTKRFTKNRSKDSPEFVRTYFLPVVAIKILRYLTKDPALTTVKYVEKHYPHLTVYDFKGETVAIYEE